MTADRTAAGPAAIEPEAYAARRERLRARLEAVDADAALVTKLVNVRYLTGFTGSNGAVLVTRGGVVFRPPGFDRWESRLQAEQTG